MNELSQYFPAMGIGTVLGIATGVAVKWVGKIALLVIGLLFIAIQFLAFADVISVDWLRLQSLADPLLDKRELWWQQFLNILTANLPFAGSFLTGLFIGLRF